MTITQDIKMYDIYMSKILSPNEFNKVELVKIESHPYYISLVTKDKIKYENYIKRSNHQLSKPSSIWENLIYIFEDINENGFDFTNNDCIIIKKRRDKLVCIHGRHRIAMLYLIYGKYAVLEVLNSHVIGINNQKIDCIFTKIFAKQKEYINKWLYRNKYL